MNNENELIHSWKIPEDLHLSQVKKRIQESKVIYRRMPWIVPLIFLLFIGYLQLFPGGTFTNKVYSQLIVFSIIFPLLILLFFWFIPIYLHLTKKFRPLYKLYSDYISGDERLIFLKSFQEYAIKEHGRSSGTFVMELESEFTSQTLYMSKSDMDAVELHISKEIEKVDWQQLKYTERDTQSLLESIDFPPWLHFSYKACAFVSVIIALFITTICQ